MNEMLSIKGIANFFSQGNERTLRAKKNISISFLCKGGSILIGFIIVPLTLGYVGKVEYGIWMTISSIISWFSFFDIGLGNGLRNKLAETIAVGNLKLARIYVSSTFALISIISLALFTGFFIAANYISWNTVLNTNEILNVELLKIVVTVFFFFCIGFVMKLTSSVLQALQKYAINDILGLIAQVLGLVAMYVLVKSTEGSLYRMCLVYGSKQAIVLLVASVVLFSSSLKHLRPSFSTVNIRQALPLLNLGVWFFINQILYMIVSQLSVFLVVQYFGPEDVTVFNLAKKYMTIVSMLYMMVLTPFLSAFTEAFTKKEYEWIKRTMKNINLIWYLSVAAMVLLALFNKLFFRLWVGDQIQVPQMLIVVLAISSIIGTGASTYTLFLNGIGRIKLQFYVLLVEAIIYLPFSYLLYKSNFGLSSVVLPRVLFSSIKYFIFKLQYLRNVDCVAKGVWLK